MALVLELSKLGKLNSRQLEQKIPFLIARDGAKCYKCNKPLHELKQKVTVDHKDPEGSNDNENLGLLCYDCNRKKYKTPLSDIVSDRPKSPEMAKHDITYPKFVNLLMHEINENHSCCFQEALYDLSRVAGITPEPARRHIKQQLGKHGILGIAWGKCKSQLCDGVHIYLKEQLPTLEADETGPTLE